jgi:hypothetical protein
MTEELINGFNAGHAVFTPSHGNGDGGEPRETPDRRPRLETTIVAAIANRRKKEKKKKRQIRELIAAGKTLRFSPFISAR